MTKSKRVFKVTQSAWDSFRMLKRAYTPSKVSDELYQWYVSDAKTLGYVYMGTLRLLSKPEDEALKIIQNVADRLEGGGQSWNDFVAP